MPEGDSPAAVLDAATAPVTSTETQAASQEPPATPVETSEQPAPQPSTEPDIDSLLKDSAFKDRLLKHPEFAKDFEHRAKSVREADVERRAEEKAREHIRQAQAAAQAQIDAATKSAQLDQYWARVEQTIGEDPDSPSSQLLAPQLQSYKANKAATVARQAAKAELEPTLRNTIERETFGKAGEYWMSALDAVVRKEKWGLTPEEVTNFNPRDPKHLSADQFIEAFVDYAADKLAEKRMKSRLPTEVEAKVQERLATGRQQEKAPVTLPPGEGGMNDEAFAEAFASGKSNDTARQLKWMRSNGIL